MTWWWVKVCLSLTIISPSPDEDSSDADCQEQQQSYNTSNNRTSRDLWGRNWNQNKTFTVHQGHANAFLVFSPLTMYDNHTTLLMITFLIFIPLKHRTFPVVTHRQFGNPVRVFYWGNLLLSRMCRVVNMSTAAQLYCQKQMMSLSRWN